MEISFQAFHWSCDSPKFKLENFLKSCCSVNGKAYRNRITYFIHSNNRWHGLILTIKDIKKFVTLMESSQEVKLHELNENEKLADFNFFIFDEKSSFGLYQHYHHSCSLNTFNNIAKYYYNEFRKIEREKIRHECESKQLTKLKTKLILKDYNGKFSSAIVERQGKFLERVTNMQDAYSADLEFFNLDYVENEFTPIKPYLKNFKYKFSFEKDNGKTVSGKIKNFASVLSNINLKKATVVGLDEYGNDVAYRLSNDFDKFKTYDYEDMVPSLNLDKNKVETSILNNKIITELNAVFDNISSSLIKR